MSSFGKIFNHYSEHSNYYSFKFNSPIIYDFRFRLKKINPIRLPTTTVGRWTTIAEKAFLS